jgi:hypothetical protein
VALAGQASAQSDEAGIEGRKLAETIFASMLSPGGDHVNMGDIEQFRASSFAAMDGDGDGQVSYAEFASWDPGFARIAETQGRGEAYVTASKIVYAFWDRDGNDSLNEREYRIAMSHDFRRADLDGDALLSESEFIGGFPMMVAMRAAIRPDL